MKKFIFYSLTIVTLLILGVTVAGWIAQRSWVQRKAELLASKALDPVETVIPPRIPDAQNFAAIPILQPQWEEIAKERPPGVTDDASRFDLLPILNLGRPERRNLSFGNTNNALTGYWGMPDLNVVASTIQLAPEAPGETIAQTILRSLEPQRATLEALAEGLHRPGCRFPVRYERTIAAVQPSAMGFQRVAQVFAIRAAARLEAGLVDEAARDVVSVLQLGTHFRRDPGLVRALVGAACSAQAAHLIWQGLVRVQWEERHLQAFERELVQVDLFRDYRNSVRLELTVSLLIWEDSLRSGGNFLAVRNLLAAVSEASAPVVLGNALLYPCLSAQARVSARIRAALPEARPAKFAPAAFEAAMREVETASQRWDGMMLALSLPSYQRSFQRIAGGQSRLELCLTAVRLERARRASARFPTTLAGLELPNDFMTGLPTKYELSADGSRYRLLREAWQREGGPRESKAEAMFNPWEWYSNVGGPGTWN